MSTQSKYNFSSALENSNKKNNKYRFSEQLGFENNSDSSIEDYYTPRVKRNPELHKYFGKPKARLHSYVPSESEKNNNVLFNLNSQPDYSPGEEINKVEGFKEKEDSRGNIVVQPIKFEQQKSDTFSDYIPSPDKFRNAVDESIEKEKQEFNNAKKALEHLIVYQKYIPESASKLGDEFTNRLRKSDDLKIEKTPSPIEPGMDKNLVPKYDVLMTPGGRAVGSFTQGVLGVFSGLSGAGEYLGIPGTKSASRVLDEWQATVAPHDQNFVEQTISGAGSMAIFLPFGVGVGKAAELLTTVSPKAAKLLGLTGMTFLESATEAGQVYKESGGNSEAAEKTFLANMVLVGVTNKFGIGNEAKGLLKQILLSAPLEGLQEGAQSIISSTAQGKDINWEEVGTSIGVGAIIGAGSTGMFEVDNLKNYINTEFQKNEYDVNDINNEVIRAYHEAPKIGKDYDKSRFFQRLVPDEGGTDLNLVQQELPKINELTKKYKNPNGIKQTEQNIDEDKSSKNLDSVESKNLNEVDLSIKSKEEENELLNTENDKKDFESEKVNKENSNEISNKITDAVQRAINNDNIFKKLSISKVNQKQIEDIQEKTGIEINESYKHVIDFSAIRHTLQRHGEQQEKNHDQIPVTKEDFEKIPEILETYDEIYKGETSRRGIERIVYRKRYNGTTYYIEEVRNKKKDLALKTMYKKRSGEQLPKSIDHPHTSETLPNTSVHGIESRKSNVINQGTNSNKDIVNTKISDIYTDENKFQNRNSLNKDIIKNIVENYDPDQFDPIILWKDPKSGSNYVLSGHHRFEAAKTLKLEKVPTRYKSVSEEEAIRFAREEANANRTMESPLERAAIYRNDRLNGKEEKEIKDKAKKLELKNSNVVLNYSYLNPSGKTYSALESMQNISDKKSSSVTETIAEWIGQSRRFYKQLTDAHEDELFNFLTNQNGYEKLKNKTDFLDKIDRAVNNIEFKPTKPLNISNRSTRSGAEIEFEAEVNNLMSDLKAEKKRRDEKTRKYIELEESGKKPEISLSEYLKTENDNIVSIERELNKLAKKKNEVREESLLQNDLFGALDNEEVDERGAFEFIKNTGRKDKSEATIKITENQKGNEGSENKRDGRERDQNGGLDSDEKPLASNGAITTPDNTPFTKKPLRQTSASLKSDLNKPIKLRDISRKLISVFNTELGQGIRTGLIKRFSGRAKGLYFPQSGIVRVNNLEDVKTVAHELGHKIDYEVFNFTEQVLFENNNVIDGIITRTNGIRDQQRREKLLNKYRNKYGKEIVDNFLHRAQMRKELASISNYAAMSASKGNYKEGVAEYIAFYIIDNIVTKAKAPVFTALFENILKNTPELNIAIESAKRQFIKYQKQSPEAELEAKFERKNSSNFLNGIKNQAGKLKYNFLDNLAPLRELSEKLQKKGEVNSEDDPLLQALSLLGVDGKAKQFLENHPFERKYNDVKIIKDSKGLLKIFEKAIKDGTIDRHEQFLAAKRNVELISRNLEGIQDESRSEQVIKNFENEFGKDYADELLNDLNKYNEALLSYYKDSGKLSQIAYDNIRELNKYYVPFQRVFEDWENQGFVYKPSKYLRDSSPSPVKKIKGSQRPIKPILETLIENTYNMIASADRNRALISLINALKKIDSDMVQKIPLKTFKKAKIINDGNLETKASLVYEVPKEGNFIKIWNNGNMSAYEIPKSVFESFISINEKVPEWINMMAFPAKLLRTGAVQLDPTFGVRNIGRDQVTATFYSKHGYIPVYDFMKGIFNSVGNSEIYQKFLASGADMSFLAALDQITSQRYQASKVAGNLKKLPIRYAKNPLKAFQDFNRATELGTRVGAFEKAYKKTGDVYQAMREGREVSADYAISGKAVKGMAQLLPFFGARIQHVRMFSEVLKGNKGAVSGKIAKGIGIYSFLSAVTWFMNHDDPDREKLYNELPGWRRSLFWNIPLGETFIAIPKGVYGVVFGTSTEAVLDYLRNESTDELNKLSKNVFNEVSPINSAYDLVPQAIKPLVEIAANYKSYSESPIVPKSLENESPKMQYTFSTPEIFKWLGENTGLSPLKMQYFIDGYAAGTGKYVYSITDIALQKSGVLPEQGLDSWTILSRMPFTKAFVVEPYIGVRGASIHRFYEKLDELEKAKSQYYTAIYDGDPKPIEKLFSKYDELKWYLENQTEINKFREVLSYIKTFRTEVMNDKSINNKREVLNKIQMAVTNTALSFYESYQSKTEFNASQTFKDVIKKIKAHNKEKNKRRKSALSTDFDIKHNSSRSRSYSRTR